MSDRWGQQSDKLQNAMERIAVLERDNRYLQEAIAALQRNQADNRAFTEARFNQVMTELADVKSHIGDLRLTIAAKPTISPEQEFTRRGLIGIGISLGLLIIVLLGLAVLLWVHPWIRI